MKSESIEEAVIYEKLTAAAGENYLTPMSEQCSQVADHQGSGDSAAYFNEISRYIQTMEMTRESHPEYNMTKPDFWRPTKVVRYFSKKIVRKCTDWALGLAYERQTRFNRAVVPSVGRLTELTYSSLEAIQQLDEKIQQIENDQIRLENDQIRQMNERVRVVENWQVMNAHIMDNVSKSIAVLEEQGIINRAKAIQAEDEDENIARHSLSQTGEDSIIAHILRMLHIPERNCSYLDLGANHAKRFSNTYYFYDKGARGVLVEANPALIPELKLYRNEDQIVNCCISDREDETLDFYILSGDGMSTPDIARAEEVIARNPAELRIDRVVSVKAMTVNHIMEKYFQEAPLFMNIDIEGDDLKILSSIDWEKWRPLIVTVETIPYRPTLVVGEKDLEIIRFMESIGYIEYAFTGINSIFLDKKRVQGGDL